MNLAVSELPRCECGGVIVPFTDEGRKEGVVVIRGWACLSCHKNLVMRSGILLETEIKKVEVPS
jgi:hypothetical protein